jgi:hypothetical protein
MVLATVAVVEEIPVLPVKAKTDVEVAVLLGLGEVDDTGGRHAAAQDLEPLGIPDVLHRIAVPATLGGLRRGGDRPGGGGQDAQGDHGSNQA